MSQFDDAIGKLDAKLDSLNGKPTSEIKIDGQTVQLRKQM